MNTSCGCTARELCNEAQTLWLSVMRLWHLYAKIAYTDVTANKRSLLIQSMIYLALSATGASLKRFRSYATSCRLKMCDYHLLRTL